MKTGTVKLLAYLLLAATFASLLSISMDRHFEEMATQRINFQGWGGHTLARVVSPVLVGLVHSSGIPVKTSALIYIGISTFLLLNAYAWYLGKSVGLDSRVSLLAAPLILIPMIWNYILLSSAHYIDDVPAILFFVLGLGLLSNRDCPPHYSTCYSL